ncbi:hypothetical protein NDU88_006309 [Pleurodeles waltl]|uniref:Uncharacterized protein n=1 Tax=Pleurodeles waltl TaxID=8319 RepID=A0AAV7SP58_PLEWA|nr:hypothetical protein NDU88_006309 [Pleurodeles waltl]
MAVNVLDSLDRCQPKTDDDVTWALELQTGLYLPGGLTVRRNAGKKISARLRVHAAQNARCGAAALCARAEMSDSPAPAIAGGDTETSSGFTATAAWSGSN